MRVQARCVFISILALAMLVCFALTSSALAQGKNPYAGDAKIAKIGESQFRANCAFCHGLGARGGGRGPDLTRTPKKHGDSDQEIFTVISNGVPGTAMPPNGATHRGVGITEEEIWQVITYIRSVEHKSVEMTGDAKRDRELFFGKRVHVAFIWSTVAFLLFVFGAIFGGMT